MPYKMQTKYTEILMSAKNENRDKQISLAFVKEKHKNKLVVYDPKLQKDITIDVDCFGKGEAHASCVVGDIIEYNPKKNILDTDIVRNLTNEQRIKAFQSAYNTVYGR